MDVYLYHLNKNIDNNINEYSKDNTSFQVYDNCEEILDIFGDFSKEKNIFKNLQEKE